MTAAGQATLDAPARADADQLTIVVPTYNESTTVAAFMRSVEAVLPGVAVIVADDDSPDPTRETALGSAGTLKVEVLHRRSPADRGLTASVADAILGVRTPRLVVMDVDLQHPPQAIPALAAALDGGADLAVATRADDSSFSWKRRLVSRVARSLARRHVRRRSGADLRDPMSGFFAMRTDLAQEIVRAHGAAFERQGFKVLLDLVRHAPRPLRVAEVPYSFGARSSGESKLSHRHYLSFLRQLGGAWRMTASFLDLVLTGILFRFLAVGATGIGINLLTLFAFHEGMGIPIALAAPAAIELSVLWNFAWNESWTFRGRDTGTRLGTRLWQFHVASLAGMLLQYGVLAGGTAFGPGLHYAWWSVMGIALGSAANF
ncbi:MAG TPA: GtrA family protein, partial [Candidatus Thermoplasmatota archaeon]|nr:GtrA family protein [Candidatus Thermoplasmatota archaeon]